MTKEPTRPAKNAHWTEWRNYRIATGKRRRSEIRAQRSRAVGGYDGPRASRVKRSTMNPEEIEEAFRTR